MELEELKNEMDRKATAAYEHARASSGSLKFDAGRKSISLLEKILTSLRWELAFSVTFAIGCILLAVFSTSTPIIVFLVLLVAYSTGFSIYLFRLHNNTRDQVVATGTIISSVTGMIRIIERYTSLYIQLSTSFIPAVFLAALVAGMIDFLQTNDSPVKIPWISIIIGALIIGIWIILIRRFTRWWLNRRYGTYLLELKERLNELHSNE